MRRMVQSQGVYRALASACVASSLIATATWSQTLTWLGTLGGIRSDAWGVSADGRVVVGDDFQSDYADVYRPFRWTASGGMQGLFIYGLAYGVSADGSVVVGIQQDLYNAKAFRWTASGGVQALAPNYSIARGVSADGSVVVGASGWRAFRWAQATGMQDLGALDGVESAAYGVSADGSVVVGASGGRAFRWTQTTGMVALGTLPGGRNSSAYGVSADGSVVVGWARNADGQDRAFRWAQATGMRDLGTLNDVWSVAYGVSADGSVVVGASGIRAFRWTQARGMEDLNQTYACLLTDRSELMVARAISPDGRYIVGTGYNAASRRYEAYLLDTEGCISHSGDVDNNGCVDDEDLLAVLFAFGNMGSNLCRVDVNCDNTVDDADLLIVLFNFGSGC